MNRCPANSILPPSVVEKGSHEANDRCKPAVTCFGRPDLAEVVHQYMALHRDILESTGNANLLAMWLPIVSRMFLHYSRHRSMMESYREHARIVGAIRKRDRKTALEAPCLFPANALDGSSRHAGHRDGRVVAGTSGREIGDVQHAVGRVQVVVHRATRTHSQQRRDLAAVEINPGRIAAIARGQQMRARPRARASAADPIQRFADRIARWNVVDEQVFFVAGEQLAAGNESRQPWLRATRFPGRQVASGGESDFRGRGSPSLPR